jgi:uncharacterized protein YodC (DUF2158 family)
MKIPAGTIVVLKSGGPAMTIIEVDRTDGLCSVTWFDPQGVLQRDAFSEAEIVVVGATDWLALRFVRSAPPPQAPEPVERPEPTGREKIDWSTEPHPQHETEPAPFMGLAELKSEGDPIPPSASQKVLDEPTPPPVPKAPSREKTPRRPQGGRARPKGAPNKLTTYESVLGEPQQEPRRVEREKAPAKTLNRAGTTTTEDGYRPPAGTIAKVVEDEDDDKPVFDKGRIGTTGWEKPRGGPSKAELREQLREAVHNTADREPE